MSITTTYECDNCGRSQQTPTQMWRIDLGIQHLPEMHTRGAHSNQRTADWCRKCVEAAHLLPNVVHKEAKEELPPQPSLNDLVRQIVREEMEVVE